MLEYDRVTRAGDQQKKCNTLHSTQHTLPRWRGTRIASHASHPMARHGHVPRGLR